MGQSENDKIQLPTRKMDSDRLKRLGGRVIFRAVEIGSLRSTIVTFLKNVADRTAGSGKPVLLV